jgi:hypothetical protein
MRAGSRSSTGPVLRRLRRLIVAATALALGTSMWTFLAARDLGQVIRGGAAPTIVELSTARRALLQAEQIAVGCPPPTGCPGGRPGAPSSDSYQAFLRQVEVVYQSLGGAAASAVVDGGGGGLLQSVQGQLVSYQGIIAGVVYGQPAEYGADLSRSDLADAYGLMHGDSGMMPALDRLIVAQQDTVNRLADSGRLSPWAVPVWLLPLVALLALLVGTQIFLSRRLRRTVNPWLLGATAVLLAAIGYGGALVVGYRFGADSDYLLARVSSTEAAERKAHAALLDRIDCETAYCGRTLALPVDRDLVDLEQAKRSVRQQAPDSLKELTSPPPDRPGPVLLSVAALTVAGLGWVGLQGPVDQYRFER